MQQIIERQQHGPTTAPANLRCLITGGSGFIGRHLAAGLIRPRVLSRNPDRIQNRLPGVEYLAWPGDSPPGPELFKGIDTVFHLAGESVFRGRWSKAKKERIRQSRIDGTRHLVRTLAKLEQPPARLICSSAIGYYGDRGNELLTEASAPGNDFLARVCRDWEAEAMAAAEYGIRTVCIRTGIVLGQDGGALPKMLTPFRLGLGGPIGSGNQYMSWIHIDDQTGIMLHAACQSSISGAINAVAPQCVTNRQFTSNLAAILRRPAVLPVPRFLLRLLLGEFAGVVLASQRAVPEKALNSGYDFRFPAIRDALQDIIS